MKIRYLVLPPCHFGSLSFLKPPQGSLFLWTSGGPATPVMVLPQQACSYFTIDATHRKKPSGEVEEIPGPPLQNTKVLIPGIVLDGSAF